MFTILKYIRAEREADWPLHLATVTEMMPMFFSAGHINYARYALYYLNEMELVPSEIAKHFMDGEHTMHHIDGLFNGIWSDMAIETTFMRYGHGQNGIVGITLKPETLETWSYSLHTCSSLTNDLQAMRDREPKSCQSAHKEEFAGRRKTDALNRDTIRGKLELCINPLNPEQHADGLVNIVTGKVVTHPQVNVDNAIHLGTTQMAKFEQSLPGGFYGTLSKCVNTMALTRKHIKVGETKVFDMETIYARAMCLQFSERNLNTENLLSHELSPYPASMFDEHGHMREAKNKSQLKNSLQVESSSRLAGKDVNAIVLDGCAVLWVVPWPTVGNVKDYLEKFRRYIFSKLKSCDTYLVFDRYKDGSIKESKRCARDKGASRTYKLGPNTRLPPKHVVLTVTSNKAQLIDLI